MFELINYSEFGTEINGQLYTCDFTDHTDAVVPDDKYKAEKLAVKKEKPREESDKTGDIDRAKIKQEVQMLIDKRRNITRKKYSIDDSW